MQGKTLIIQGSSRSEGDTQKVVQYLQDCLQCDVVDLLQKEIGYFDYEFRNRDDDFLPLMREVVEKYQNIIFVTPVYWYSMSAVMKTFFDRISDLLKIEKETGRRLRKMNMAMISCSGSDDLVNGFNIPFVESANYLGMDYLGDLHCWVENGRLAEAARKQLQGFIEKLAV